MGRVAANGRLRLVVVWEALPHCGAVRAGGILRIDDEIGIVLAAGGQAISGAGHNGYVDPILIARTAQAFPHSGHHLEVRFIELFNQRSTLPRVEITVAQHAVVRLRQQIPHAAAIA